MTEPENHPASGNNKGAKSMEFLFPVSLLVAWFILQAWILPCLGVKT
jgi:hypothetical protein